jgi:hypothetical protein
LEKALEEVGKYDQIFFEENELSDNVDDFSSTSPFPKSIKSNSTPLSSSSSPSSTSSTSQLSLQTTLPSVFDVFDSIALSREYLNPSSFSTLSSFLPHNAYSNVYSNYSFLPS